MITHTNTYRRWAVLVATTLAAACGENPVQVLPTNSPEAARIKFFNFGVNAPAVNFYADDVKMTAILSATGTEATTGVAYGGVGNGGAYSQIAPGAYTLTGRIAEALDKDRPIATLSSTIADEKFYSLYLSGFYDSTAKASDGFVVEDAYPPQIDFTVAYVRFVHAIANANPLTLYAANTTTTDTVVVNTAVAYKSGGAFTSLPPGIYNLFARYPDSTTNKIVRTAVTLAGGRVYTVGARGNITITSTTATNRALLDNATNR
jgi:uncharacterized protein DUF4397